jgi:trimethylamine:corrinoid methyltransferase-like protein
MEWRKEDDVAGEGRHARLRPSYSRRVGIIQRLVNKRNAEHGEAAVGILMSHGCSFMSTRTPKQMVNSGCAISPCEERVRNLTL